MRLAVTCLLFAFASFSSSCIETSSSQRVTDYGLSANLEDGERLHIDSLGVPVEIVNAGPGDVVVQIPGASQTLPASSSMHTNGAAGVISNVSGSLACLRVIQPVDSNVGVKMVVERPNQ